MLYNSDQNVINILIFSGTLAANVAVTGNIQINGKKRSLYSKEVVR